MRSVRWLVVAALSACTGCGANTNIAGTYAGNVTYTASVTAPSAGSLAGAEPENITVTDGTNSGVTVTLGAGCSLTASKREQVVTDDGGGNTWFIFTSEDIAATQPCTVPVTGGTITFAVGEGDFVVDTGLTVTMQVGGSISAATGVSASAGYLAFEFGGASQ